MRGLVLGALLLLAALLLVDFLAANLGKARTRTATTDYESPAEPMKP